jgi:hypothetical protein
LKTLNVTKKLPDVQYFNRVGSRSISTRTKTLFVHKDQSY